MVKLSIFSNILISDFIDLQIINKKGIELLTLKKKIL